MASGHSGAITGQGSRQTAEIPEKKAYGSDRSCKAALIALGIICMIGGAVATGVLYSHLGYISLSCLGADLVGIILIALSSRYKPAHQSPTTLNHQQSTAGSDHSKSRDTSTGKNILKTLTQQAKIEDQAFLIDFSQVRPSNMFDIFKKDCDGDYFGAAAITDEIDTWRGLEPSSPFSSKYSITIVLDSTDSNRQRDTFAMDSEGRVVFHSLVFNHFGAFLQQFMRTRQHGHSEVIKLPKIDFTSSYNQTLRINNGSL